MADIQYPPGSILAEMMIDIYASKRRDDILILYDKPFAEELSHLEFNTTAAQLVFVFGEKRRDLGAPLRNALHPYFQKMDEITLAQMNMETRLPVHMMSVPLKQVDTAASAAFFRWSSLGRPVFNDGYEH